MRTVRCGLFGVFLFTLACSSKDAVPVPTVLDYFPVKKGAYLVYAVDSTVIFKNIENKYSYQLRVEVADSFPNGEGGYTYPLYRSKQMVTGGSWQAINSWSVRVTRFESVVNEGNIPYLKIAGPVAEGKAWNGNAYNTLAGTEKCIDSDAHNCDLYTISNFGKSLSTDGLAFDNTLTVVENNNADPIVAQDIRSAVYAKNVGLVRRDITQLEFCSADPDCVGTQFVNKGLRYTQIIVEYGGF